MIDLRLIGMRRTRWFVLLLEKDASSMPCHVPIVVSFSVHVSLPTYPHPPLTHPQVADIQSDALFILLVEKDAAFVSCRSQHVTVIAFAALTFVLRFTCYVLRLAGRGHHVGCAVHLLLGKDAAPMGSNMRFCFHRASQVADIQSDALFILLVEKDAAFMRLAEDRFYNQYPCIILTAKVMERGVLFVVSIEVRCDN